MDKKNLNHKNIHLKVSNSVSNAINLPKLKRLKWCSLAFIIFTFVSSSVIILVQYEYSDQAIYIDTSLRPHKIDDKFLSLGLDSSIAANRFRKFNLTSFKLIKLIKHMTPCYLRLGGNLADRLRFVLDENGISFEEPPSIDECSDFDCFSGVPNYTISGPLWLKFNKFIENTGAKLIFDLNALLRNPDGSWNTSNAKELISFSSWHDLKLDWELGNEPNSFFHKFNEAVNASQLAKDYHTLKGILMNYDLYRRSLLVGPSITRIRTSEISQYFRTFLQGGAKVVSAVTWHHYYFNGRNATESQFLSPKVFDLFKMHIHRVRTVMKDLTLQYKPLWLGETSSAWGGGAPNMSNRFIDTFIWIDKLGLAAKMGVSLIIRQSIFGGYYALLDDNYDPNPDYWVSILYKQLVSTTVLPSSLKYDSKVRLYAHCAKTNVYNSTALSSLVVFGSNVDNSARTIRVYGVSLKPIVKAFELTTEESSLLSRNVFLNGHLLQLMENYDLPNFTPKTIDLRKQDLAMPAYSVCFWILELDTAKYCGKFKFDGLEP